MGCMTGVDFGVFDLLKGKDGYAKEDEKIEKKR